MHFSTVSGRAMDSVPPPIASKLLVYSRELPAPVWEKLKLAYTTARRSYEHELALKMAERAVFGRLGDSV